MKLIPNSQRKNLRCHFCGETRSVKYSKTIFNPVLDSKPTEVCFCNKCALTKGAKMELNREQNLEDKYEVLMDFAERLLDTKCKICNDYYIFADNVKVILTKMLTEGGEDR